MKTTEKDYKTHAPCIGHKWKDAVIEEHNAQSQQPE